jgi:hypothetical protein
MHSPIPPHFQIVSLEVHFPMHETDHLYLVILSRRRVLTLHSYTRDYAPIFEVKARTRKKPTIIVQISEIIEIQGGIQTDLSIDD